MNKFQLRTIDKNPLVKSSYTRMTCFLKQKHTPEISNSNIYIKTIKLP